MPARMSTPATGKGHPTLPQSVLQQLAFQGGHGQLQFAGRKNQVVPVPIHQFLELKAFSNLKLVVLMSVAACGTSVHGLPMQCCTFILDLSSLVCDLFTVIAWLSMNSKNGWRLGPWPPLEEVRHGVNRIVCKQNPLNQTPKPVNLPERTPIQIIVIVLK